MLAENTTMDKRQIFAIIGCFMLFVGVFAPFISVPILGSMNYFQNGKGDGTVVLMLAVTSLVAVLYRKYRWLWVTGLGSLGLLAFAFFKFQYRMSSMKADIAKRLGRNPFHDLGDFAIQMEWGWALLLAGSLMLLIAAGMNIKGASGGQESNPPLDSSHA